MIPVDQLLATPVKVVTGEVTVPEWGKVKVREMSSDEVYVDGTDKNVMAFYVLHGVLNEDGSQYFKQEHLAWLKKQPARILRPIANMIIDLGAPEEKTKAKNA